MNVPNAVTIARILLAPVIVVVLLESEGASAVAAAVFAFAASTDGIDGYLARSRKSVTTLGKVIDPIADKVLIVAALVTLVALDRVAAWVTIVVIARELLVSGLRLVAAQQGTIIAASRLGKAKTFSQVAAVIALILASEPGAAWVLVMVYAAVAITAVSGIDYFVAFRRGQAGVEEEAAAAEPTGGTVAASTDGRAGVAEPTDGTTIRSPGSAPAGPV